LENVEALVVPLLQKLRDTGDKEYIYWPNRKEIIDKQINKILKLTRE
jgi:predicted lipoprotein